MDKVFHMKSSESSDVNFDTELSPLEEIELLSSHGNVFELYKIGKIIGKGYSGSKIYQATHRKSHEKYAIKVIQLDRIQGVSLEDLVKEMKLLRYLKHPNLIKCFGIYFRDNILYYVFEYCEMGSLQDIYSSIFVFIINILNSTMVLVKNILSIFVFKS